MIHPELSVLVTSYNREAFIATTLNSILQSTYKNYELIVCDDASTDNTLEIINEFCRNDIRVKCFVNQQNLGDYANRNKAASLARGKYIKYVDSDDCIYPHTLEQMMNYMNRFSDAGWGMSIDTPLRAQPFPVRISSNQAYAMYYDSGELFCYSPLRAIIKKDFFNLVGGFKQERMVADFEMWHKLAKQTDVILMPGGMTWYRKHEKQEGSDQRKFAFAYEQIRKLYLAMKDVPLTDEHIKSIIKKRKYTILKILIKSLLKGNITECLFRIKLLWLYR